MKTYTAIHGTQRMNFTDFGNPLTFHLAPPAGQNYFTYSVKYLNSY